MTRLSQGLTLAKEQIERLREELAARDERIAELEQSQGPPPRFVKPNKPKRENTPVSVASRESDGAQAVWGAADGAGGVSVGRCRIPQAMLRCYLKTMHEGAR